MCKPIRAEVSPGSKRTLGSYHEKPIRVQGLDQLGSYPGSGQKPRRLCIGTCMVSTNTCTNIISITLLQAFGHKIHHMTLVHAYNPVQICRSTRTNPSQTQIQYKLDDARKDTRLNTNPMKTAGTPESYAHELRGGKTPKQEVDEGLGPLIVVGLGEDTSCLGRLRGWLA